jgi:hypothetical protein
MERLAYSAFNARGGIKTLVLPAIAGATCNHLGLTWAVNRTAGAALLGYTDELADRKLSALTVRYVDSGALTPTQRRYSR